MPDYPAQVVAPALYQELATQAPLLEIEFQPWQGDAQAAASLERGDTELLLGALLPTNHMRGREVLQERCVVVMRRDHPAAHQLTLRRWLEFPHLQISCHDTLNRMLDEQLAAQGHKFEDDVPWGEAEGIVIGTKNGKRMLYGANDGRVEAGAAIGH